MTLSEAIKLNNFDEFEISAILQLLFLKYGNLTRFLVKIVILESGFFSSDEAKRKFSNDVVGGLYAEYKRSSKDFTLSFDRVATILSAFHVSQAFFRCRLEAPQGWRKLVCLFHGSDRERKGLKNCRLSSEQYRSVPLSEGTVRFVKSKERSTRNGNGMDVQCA